MTYMGVSQYPWSETGVKRSYETVSAFHTTFHTSVSHHRFTPSFHTISFIPFVSPAFHTIFLTRVSHHARMHVTVWCRYVVGGGRLVVVVVAVVVVVVVALIIVLVCC